MNDRVKNGMQNNRPDFGEDSDVVPPSDPAFDAWIARVAPTLNEPRQVPRVEMWQAIQAARDTANDAQAGKVPGVIPLRRAPWRLLSVIAAALLLGVALDRFMLRKADRRTDASSVAEVRPAPDSGDNSPARMYRLAAAQTLTQAEALLTAYRANGGPERNPADARQLGRWGRDILTSTRLLMDSPAGDDPQLRALFNDLELVLVQIIQLAGGQLDPSERGLIDRALDSKDLLPRIRTAVPPPGGNAVGVNAASDD